MKATIIGTTGVIAVLTLGIALPAFAVGTPSTTIRQSVQNQTTNSGLLDANDLASSLNAKNGDIVKYVIEIKNSAVEADKGANDLKNAKLTDTLPDGLELVSTPDKHTISEDLGTIKPGKSVIKQYLVKVVGDKGETSLTNKACFTGKYDSDDLGQSGCDDAVIKLTDGTQPTSTAPATAAPTPTSQSPLPTTGPSNGLTIVMVLIGGALAYATRMFIFTRRAQ